MLFICAMPQIIERSVARAKSWYLVWIGAHIVDSEENRLFTSNSIFFLNIRRMVEQKI